MASQNPEADGNFINICSDQYQTGKSALVRCFASNSYQEHFLWPYFKPEISANGARWLELVYGIAAWPWVWVSWDIERHTPPAMQL